MLDRGWQIVEGGLDLPAEEIDQHGAGTTIGHMDHFDAGHHLEQFAGEVAAGASAERGEIELPGLALA